MKNGIIFTATFQGLVLVSISSSLLLSDSATTVRTRATHSISAGSTLTAAAQSERNSK